MMKVSPSVYPKTSPRNSSNSPTTTAAANAAAAATGGGASPDSRHSRTGSSSSRNSIVDEDDFLPEDDHALLSGTTGATPESPTTALISQLSTTSITSRVSRQSQQRKRRELPQLFWYMELGQWDKALERLKRHPREAKVWATLKTKSLLAPTEKVTSTKRLALHHACFKLRSAAGKTYAGDDDPFCLICQFILALLRLYPDAAGQRETRHGCLPLHLAAFASCAPKEGGDATESDDDGPKMQRPTPLSRRAFSDATAATTDTHMSQIHAEESYTGQIMGDKSLRRNVRNINPNVTVAAKHKIVISAVREELAVQVVNALLDAYPKAVRVDSEGGRLPLHTACAGRATPRVVQTLVRADPAAARHRNKDGFLPLHLAAHWGVSHPNVAVTLLQSYPDATVGRNRWERTPLEEALCMAGENGRPHQAALVRSLRKHPSYWTRPTSELLHGSARQRNVNKHVPIDMDESLPSNESTTLEDGRESSSYEGFEVDFAPPGVLGKISPRLAKSKTVSAVTKTLSQLIQGSHWDAVLERLEAHPLEAEEELQVMTRGGFLASSGFYPLHYACERQPPLAVVQALIAAHPIAVLTRTMPGGCLPLHVACTWYGSKEVIQALVSADAGSCQVKDELGNMPLHCACFAGASEEVLNTLLRTDPETVLERNTQGSRPADITRRLQHGNRRSVLALLTLKKEEQLARHRKQNSSGTWGDAAAQACHDLEGAALEEKTDSSELMWI